MKCKIITIHYPSSGRIKYKLRVRKRFLGIPYWEYVMDEPDEIDNGIYGDGVRIFDNNRELNDYIVQNGLKCM